jgi:hypothetical protein
VHQVDTDDDRHHGAIGAVLGRGLDQDARDFAAVDENVVGPLQRQVLGVREDGGSGVMDAKCCNEARLGGDVSRHRQAQQQRGVEVTRIGLPCAAVAAAPGALARGHDPQRPALSRAGPAHGLGICGIKDIEGDVPHRSEVRHDQKSDNAAAWAMTTIGSATRTKPSTNTPETATISLISRGMGSNGSTGSSKNMSLTMRT